MITTPPATTAATAEEQLSQMEAGLAKFRRWFRDRMDRHRAALAAAPNPDHPSMDHDRHCAGELGRVAAELVWRKLMPANWLLPEGREADEAADPVQPRREAPAAVLISLVNPDAEFPAAPFRYLPTFEETLRSLRGMRTPAAIAPDICHGREVPAA